MSERITLNASRPPDRGGKRSIIFGSAELVCYFLPVLGVLVALMLPAIRLVREWLR